MTGSLFWVVPVCTLLVNLVLRFFLTLELRAYAEEFAAAGKPTPLFVDRGWFAFSGYVLAGSYKAIPRPGLVRCFDVLRVIEVLKGALIVWWTLALLLQASA